MAEAEGQLILVELQEITSGILELEQRWQSSEQYARTIDRSYELQYRRTELMHEWSRLQSRLPHQLNVGIQRTLREFHEARLSARMETMEAEGQRLLGQLQVLLTNYQELEDPERTVALNYALDHRAREFMDQWRRFDIEIPDQINVELQRRRLNQIYIELDQRLDDLGHRRRLLVQARWQAHMEAVGQRLLGQVQQIISDYGQLEQRWQGPDAEPPRTTRQTLLLHNTMLEFLRQLYRSRHIIPEEISDELYRIITEVGERWQRFPDQFPLYAVLLTGQRVPGERGPFFDMDQAEIARLRLIHPAEEASNVNEPLLPLGIRPITLPDYGVLVIGGRVLEEPGPVFEEASNDNEPLLPGEIILITVSGDHISDNNKITSSCPICKDDFELGKEAGQLHCGHIFHQNCILTWLRLKNNCPVCRRAFSSLFTFFTNS